MLQFIKSVTEKSFFYLKSLRKIFFFVIFLNARFRTIIQFDIFQKHEACFVQQLNFAVKLRFYSINDK